MGRLRFVALGFPEVPLLGRGDLDPIGIGEEANLRVIGVGGMNLQDYRKFAGREPHEGSGRIDPDQLDEATHEVWIEL